MPCSVAIRIRCLAEAPGRESPAFGWFSLPKDGTEMTSPRGSRAAGRPGGDDGPAGPPVGSDPREMGPAEAPRTGPGLAEASPADTAAADAASASGAPGKAARTAGTTTVVAPARPPGRAGPDRVTGQPGYQPGPIWARWLPPAVAFLVSLWGITAPSFWRDEAATIAAIKRPL